MKNILIFCGSSLGTQPVYEQTAAEIGKYLAENGYTVVYGGGNVGLMGTTARAALAAGGEVVGIIPYFLANREGLQLEVTELIQVDTMLERKQIMAQRSDAVITLPGGYGTMDEIFEELTASQLGFHKRPIGILNINGFYDPLILMLDNMVKEGFLRPENRRLLLVANNLTEMMEKLKAFTLEVAK
jgi:hypothetical protein